MKIGFQKKLAFKITTPEIICDLFSFLNKDQIERIQLVNRFWNNIIIRRKNILPLRQFYYLIFYPHEIDLYATNNDFFKGLVSYKINFDGTNLSKIEEGVPSRYSQLTADEVLNNLNNVLFHSIQINNCGSEDHLGNILNLVNFVTTKTGVRFRGRRGHLYWIKIFDSKLAEIIDNCIIVNGFFLHFLDDSYIREVCENPEIVQLPSTLKSIKLGYLQFKENDEVLNFTCNGKLNGANRVTITIDIFYANCGNFIREWFELYRTHQNPISLVGKFELLTHEDSVDSDSVLDAAKTFLNNPQLRVKYSLEAKEFSNSVYPFTKQFLIRRCVLHETDTYALMIEMVYDVQTDTSSINASDFDQPPCNRMYSIIFCVELLFYNDPDADYYDLVVTGVSNGISRLFNSTGFVISDAWQNPDPTTFYPGITCQVFSQTYGVSEFNQDFNVAWAFLNNYAPKWPNCSIDSYPWAILVLGFVAALRGQTSQALSQIVAIENMFHNASTNSYVTINELGFYLRTKNLISGSPISGNGI